MADQDTDLNLKLESLVVHAGYDHRDAQGAISPPICMSSTYSNLNGTEKRDHIYSRLGNPNRDTFEQAVAAIEDATYGIAFSSGMAVTAAVLSLLRPGDHVVRVDDMYAANTIQIDAETERLNVSVSKYDNMNSLCTALIPGQTRLVWLETPTNPTLQVFDISAVAKAVHAADALLVVDNTISSGALQRPLSLNADISINSATKYLNGHSDVVLGIALTSNDDIHDALRNTQINAGASPSPFDCFLATRGLRTLALRMRAHCQNALAVAAFLQEHKFVLDVIYPGLPSHPQHNIAKRQATGFGGIVSFYVKNKRVALAVLEYVQLITSAVSLGAVESLIEHPASMTHAGLPVEARNRLNITDNLLRLSIGIEHADDIIADLDKALVFAMHDYE